MNGSLTVHTSLSHPAVPSSQYLEDSLYALLDVQPVADPQSTSRPPLNLVLVIDASATMHHFHLSDEEQEYWLGVAISRDELQRGEADEAEAVFWTGQTLLEMQSVARTAMAQAVDAIKTLLDSLKPDDQMTLIAFADRVHTVFTRQDWANFSDGCLTQLDLLSERRLPVDIGTGTHMAEALRQAQTALSQGQGGQKISRLIVISDGIVQDAEETILTVEEVQSAGTAITTIGVGEEFDEEFLTRVADITRGEYHYAPVSADIAERLTQEMATLATTSITDLYLAVRGLEGAVVQDVFMVRPAMTLFEEVHTEDGWLRTRVGDISSTAPAGIIVQFAPPILPKGDHELLEALLTWTGPGGNDRIVVSAKFTDDAAEWEQVNPAVQDLVDRFSVYRFEREAQRAQEKGDLETAREKLGAATRQLHQLGEDTLAQEMEGQLAGLGTSRPGDGARVKRIKATTRRLASPPPAPFQADAPSTASVGTQD